MGDRRFEHSVVLLCSHSDEGALGLIVNKPASDIRLCDLFKQLEIGPDEPLGEEQPVYFGGPVESARGFVLHSRDYDSSLQTMKVSDTFGMTATIDILEDIANGTGPRQSLLMLGYAGWGPGQLEAEIADNGWLTADADPDLIFDEREEMKWPGALRQMGIDPVGLSSDAGRA